MGHQLFLPVTNVMGHPLLLGCNQCHWIPIVLDCNQRHGIPIVHVSKVATEPVPSAFFEVEYVNKL